MMRSAGGGEQEQAKKGKSKGKTVEHVLEGTHVLSDYWTFFVNYERGLLFVAACGLAYA